MLALIRADFVTRHRYFVLLLLLLLLLLLCFSYRRFSFLQPRRRATVPQLLPLSSALPQPLPSPPLPLTYACRYGLTCRQGLAPGNLLTSRSVSAAANSATAAGSDGKGSALGYVTERRNISQQQQQQQQQRATVAREQSVGIEQHFNAGEPRVNPPSTHNRRTPVRTSLSLLIQYLFS